MRRNCRENEKLLIDRAAAAEVPPAPAVREWAADKRVFISSVMAELREERQSAAAAVRSVGARPVMFEEFGGRDADPEEAYLTEVESSDVYLGILGRRYGKPLKSRFSATHAEYLHAEQHGSDTQIILWRGDSVNDTLLLTLLDRKFKGMNEGICVSVKDADVDSVQDVLRQICTAEIDPIRLASAVENKCREKWDYLLPPDLLNASFASSWIDVRGVRDAITKQLTGKQVTPGR